MAKKRLFLRALAKTLKKDASVFTRDAQGHALASHKTIIASVGIALCGLVILAITSKPSQASLKQDAQMLSVAPPIVSMETLYDFRENAEKPDAHTKHLVLKSGESLGPLLQKNGVDPNTAYKVTQAFARSYSPRALKAGQKINLYFNPKSNALSALSLKPDSEHTVFVERDGETEFKSKKVAAEFDKQIVKVKSTIKNSLYLDAGELGAPDKVIVQFAQIYAHSVDFQRDIRTGDAFELLFEIYRDHRGKTIKAGDLLFTSFSPRGKTSNYYLYTKSNKREGYYDEKGKGAKRMLMRTPVNGARLSSRFGTRRHPVLGYRKKHKGVDFAAPKGTPIMAAGKGVIERASRWSTYGNYVRIRHTDGYKTAYAHMSRFARGIKKGRHVVQGQIIGYVGATGRATGAHLHYEVIKKGRKINPMSLATLSGKPLKKSELPAFKKRMEQINAFRQSARPARVQEPEQIAEAIESAKP